MHMYMYMYMYILSIQILYTHRMQGGVSEFGFRRVVSRAAGSGKARIGHFGSLGVPRFYGFHGTFLFILLAPNPTFQLLGL